jgi:hypothetical protein
MKTNILLFSILSLIVASCGGKKNVVRTNGTTGNVNFDRLGISVNQQNSFQQIVNQTPCPQGTRRFYTYSVSVASNGWMQSQPQAHNGTVPAGNSYFGVSSNSIVVVTTVGGSMYLSFGVCQTNSNSLAITNYNFLDYIGPGGLTMAYPYQPGTQNTNSALIKVFSNRGCSYGEAAGQFAFTDGSGYYYSTYFSPTSSCIR